MQITVVSIWLIVRVFYAALPRGGGHRALSRRVRLSVSPVVARNFGMESRRSSAFGRDVPRGRIYTSFVAASRSRAQADNSI